MNDMAPIIRIGKTIINPRITPGVELVSKGTKTDGVIRSLLQKINPLYVKGEKVDTIREEDIPGLEDITLNMSNLRDRAIKKNDLDYTVLEISPSKMTSNMNVKWLMSEFARLYKPLTDRISLESDEYFMTYEQEMMIWWEVLIRHNQIGFYLVVPDKEGVKEGLARQVMKCWKQSNVKVITDPMPQFVEDTTDVAKMHLKYHQLLSLDIDNTHFSILESLLNAKHYLKEGDVTLLQIGLRPRGSEWNDSMMTLLDTHKQTEDVPRRKGEKPSIKKIALTGGWLAGLAVEGGLNMFGNSFIPGWEESDNLGGNKKFLNGSIESNATRFKAKSDAFDTSINIVVQCPDSERRKAVIRSITSGFDPMEGDNKLVESPTRSDKIRHSRLQSVMSRKMPGTVHDVLCANELAKIINVPDQKAQIDHYNELSLVTNKGESEVPKETFDDGKGRNIPFATIEDTDGVVKTLHYSTKNNNHLCMTRVIMGEPGTGKTTAGINFALEAFFRGYGSTFIDAADGKAIRRILKRIPPELKHKVAILDLTNTKRPIGIGWNEIFRGKEAEDLQDNLAEEVIHFIELVSGNALSMTSETWVQLAVKAVWTTPDATIQDVMRMMSDSEYRASIIPSITDFELRADWERFHNEYTKEERASICDQTFRRLYKMIRNSAVKNILLQRPKKDKEGNYLVDFRKWMDEGYLVLIYADEDLGEHIVTTLISFIIAKFNLAMISRKDIDEEDDRPPCFLILDEPDHYIKGSERWQQMLTRYRKYRCGLTFMFHGWSQLKKTDKNLPEIMRQAGPHYMIFQTDEDNLDELKSVIEPEFKVKEVAKGMPQWHSIIRLKMYGPNGQSTPSFMAKALLDPEHRLPEYDNKDVYAKCAEELGEDREVVKQDIFARGSNIEINVDDLSEIVTTKGEGTLKKVPVEDQEDKKKVLRRQRNRLLDDVSEHMNRSAEIDEDLLLHLEELGLTEG